MSTMSRSEAEYIMAVLAFAAQEDSQKKADRKLNKRIAVKLVVLPVVLIAGFAVINHLVNKTEDE